ncbi:Fe-S cluster assembly protein SufB [Vulcanisaeta sp. EB80]|uniref:Fe-S cluster assembly protein SufB n=1 Tax=Vulcanisaeta sp. EB80 TaxID=1650660 RepID=UPI0009BFFDD8|nr:Fe-S cluster assembly protein SufB [Vulcanisaeta sp. EB80]PLC67606.1 Fe-S cluster assembly protein SufB [Vulcanisaeta sp. EB80]
MSGAKLDIARGDVSGILGAAKPIPWEVAVRGKITRDMVEELSRVRGEPDWMRRLRLRALEMFERQPWPKWLPIEGSIDLESLVLYAKPTVERARSWDELPRELREYYEALKIPELEAKVLSGVIGQVDSGVTYESVKKDLERAGVVAMSMDEAVKRYPDLVKQYFTRVFPPEYKFASLNIALWGGGVFVYVPPNTHVKLPLELVILISSAGVGQFEHSLIIVGENSSVEFIVACAAPVFTGVSLHNGMTEAYIHRGARVRLVDLKNWSRGVIYFGNNRAIIEEGASVDWLSGSLGGKVTIVYPMSVLRGVGSRATVTSVALANGPTWKEEGAKVFHTAPHTYSKVVSKGVSLNGGTSVYRGLVYVREGARYAKSSVSCESLVLDERSRAYTIPHEQVFEVTATVTHEAYTGRLGEDKLFYLRSRGLGEEEARSLVVLGYFHDVMVNLPVEYVSIFNRAIELELSRLGGVG